MEGSLKCTYLQLRVTIQTPHKPGGAPFTVLKAYNGNCRIESSAWTFTSGRHGLNRVCPELSICHPTSTTLCMSVNRFA